MDANRSIFTSLIATFHQLINFRVIVLLLSYLLVPGCAPSLISIDRSELEQLKYQPVIHVVHYPPPPVEADTAATGAGIAIGGVLGGFAAHAIAQAEGEKLKNQCSLEDPSPKVREAVIKSLSNEMGFNNFRLVSELLESDELGALRNRFGDSLVMDFKTRGWTLGVEPLSQWSTRRYYVTYHLQARLIRLRDSKVMWLGYAKFVESELLSTSSTWNELTENNCTLLKTKFGQAANTCAQQLTDQLLAKSSLGK